VSIILSTNAYLKHFVGAHGSVVGWGIILQDGRSRVQFLMRSLYFFFNWPNPSSRTMTLRPTQPLTEMSKLIRIVALLRSIYRLCFTVSRQWLFLLTLFRAAS
jgi:hypothetical protein